MNNQTEQIFVFSLDGTLCHTNGDDYKNSVPIKERIEKVNDLYKQKQNSD